MRHLHSGRKLGVAPHHRKALLRSLTLAIIERDVIRTTPARAKELRWFADRVITLAKRGDVSGRRHIVKLLGSTQTYRTGSNRVRIAVERIYSDLVPRFTARQGGYTQIIRLANRRPGDNAELCLMRYLPAVEEKKTSDKKAQKPTKKAKSVDPVKDESSKKKVAASGKSLKKEDEPQDRVEKKPKSEKTGKKTGE